MIAVMLAERQLWIQLATDSESSGKWINLIRCATKFILVAVVVFLLSGLALLYSRNWEYINQPWFIVKFCCFLLFTLRGALVGGKTVEFIDKQLREKDHNKDVLMKAKTKMGRFHIIQLILVVAIIFLGVFKISF